MCSWYKIYFFIYTKMYSSQKVLVLLNLTESNWPCTKINWKISSVPIPYFDAISTMESCVKKIRDTGEGETVWLLEHPALYTAGTSAKDDDLLNQKMFPVYQSSRGGQYTYHGPGQRIAYVMLDLQRRGKDLHSYVRALEHWIIDTIATFGIEGVRRKGRVGVWVVMPDGQEAKIAALGIRIRRWVTFHGISLNVSPNLKHYEGIVPCGIQTYRITSLADLGINITTHEIDTILKHKFQMYFPND